MAAPAPRKAASHTVMSSVCTRLDTAKLDVPDDASGALVGFNLRAHRIARATLTTRYGR
jgi:phosphatidylethanolamine-binding protein (PEBP) family uncharacterized protein